MSRLDAQHFPQDVYRYYLVERYLKQSIMHDQYALLDFIETTTPCWAYVEIKEWQVKDYLPKAELPTDPIGRLKEVWPTTGLPYFHIVHIYARYLLVIGLKDEVFLPEHFYWFNFATNTLSHYDRNDALLQWKFGCENIRSNRSGTLITPLAKGSLVYARPGEPPQVLPVTEENKCQSHHYVAIDNQDRIYFFSQDKSRRVFLHAINLKGDSLYQTELSDHRPQLNLSWNLAVSDVGEVVYIDDQSQLCILDANLHLHRVIFLQQKAKYTTQLSLDVLGRILISSGYEISIYGGI